MSWLTDGALAFSRPALKLAWVEATRL